MHLDSFKIFLIACYLFPCLTDDNTNYSYRYQVGSKDDKLHFNHDEARHGDATRGSYKVLLPDGRTHVVQYNVLDKDSGYFVMVKFENNNGKKERKH